MGSAGSGTEETSFSGLPFSMEFMFILSKPPLEMAQRRLALASASRLRIWACRAEILLPRGRVEIGSCRGSSVSPMIEVEQLVPPLKFDYLLT